MKVDVFASALELAQVLKSETQLVEKPLLEVGNGVVGIFSDPNFSKTFQGLRDAKVEILKRAIEDLAAGGGTFMNSQMGVVFLQGQVRTFVELLGTPPKGNVIFSLNLKKRKAFQKFKSGEEGEEVSQEEINAAIYRLAVELSHAL